MARIVTCNTQTGIDKSLRKLITIQYINSRKSKKSKRKKKRRVMKKLKKKKKS